MKKGLVLYCLPFIFTSIISNSYGQSKGSPQKKLNKIENFSFPQSTDYTVDYLKTNFWRLSYSSAGPALAYRIVMPVKMRPTNIKATPVKDIGITLIGEYQIIDKTMPYLEVQVAYEKVSNQHPNIKSWFSEKLSKLKGTLRAEAAINIAGKNGYDVLFTRTLKSGEQYISRASMLVAGDNYVMVTAMSSKADYDKSAKAIYHILSNWNMQ